MKIINRIKKRRKKKILMDFYDWQKKQYDFYPQNKMIYTRRVNKYLDTNL